VIDRLRVPNYRGVRVPAVLGLALAGFGALSVAAVAWRASDGLADAGWVATGAAALVIAAGLVDDLTQAGPRGIRAHLAALASGTVTTGVVKLVVIAGCSVVSVAAVPGRTAIARISGIVLVAGAANLWNGLDVRPTRALRFFYPAALATLTAPWPFVPFLPGVALGALVVLPWDAGERAMLGDAGANLLGFTAGLGLFHQLHGAAVVVAALVALALNALADTVTLSRAIDAVPPLRWYDRLGRRRPPS
jgi:hypothetical protein